MQRALFFNAITIYRKFALWDCLPGFTCKKMYIDLIIICTVQAMRGLGGKAAIEVVYGQVCVGSSDDMNGVFQVVDKLVDDNTAFDFETFTHRCSSEWLLAKKNQVVSKEVSRYYMQTKRMLAENREFLDKMAAALMEKKTLLQKDIKEIRASIMS